MFLRLESERSRSGVGAAPDQSLPNPFTGSCIDQSDDVSLKSLQLHKDGGQQQEKSEEKEQQEDLPKPFDPHLIGYPGNAKGTDQDRGGRCDHIGDAIAKLVGHHGGLAREADMGCHIDHHQPGERVVPHGDGQRHDDDHEGERLLAHPEDGTEGAEKEHHQDDHQRMGVFFSMQRV